MSKDKELEKLRRDIAKAMKFKRDDTRLRKLAMALSPVSAEAYWFLRDTANYIAWHAK